MKRFAKAISWLMSALLLTSIVTGTGNGAFAAKPIKPVVQPQTVMTPAGTPVSLSPNYTSVGTKLQFCIAEVKGNNCKATATPSTALESYTVAGQGTWVLTPATGVLIFTPIRGFTGTTSTISLQANDSNGSGSAKMMVIVGSGFEPTVTSQTLDTNYATPITITPIFTFEGIDLQFCLLEAHGNNCKSSNNPNLKAETVTVRGEGTWELNPTNGVVVFTPEPTFSGTTTPVTLQANDSFGSASGTIAVRVASPLAPSLSTTIAATQFETEITVKPQATGALIVESTACLIVATTCDKNGRVDTAEGLWVLNHKDASVTFTPASEYAGVASISYQIADSFGQAVTSQIVIGVGNPAPPVAAAQNPNAVQEKDDYIRTEFGQPIKFKIKTKGSAIVPEKFCFVDPVTAICAAGADLYVEGEGTWHIDVVGKEPVVKFTPLPTFTGDATPVDVKVSDSFRVGGGKCKNPKNCNSQTGSTKVKVRVKNPTQQLTGEFFLAETQFNTPISFSPNIANLISGSKSNFCVIDPADSLCKSRVVVAGKGVWTISNGRNPITFTPEETFAGMTEPIGYMTTDQFGRSTDQPYQIQVHVLPPAKPVITFNGTRRVNYGEPTTLTPTGKGKKVDYSTACLVDPVTHDCKKTVTILGKGTWSVAANGAVTFDPALGVSGIIAPIEFQLSSVYGPSPKCDIAGPLANGRYNTSEFPDNPTIPGVGTFSCVVTATAMIGIEYNKATAPRVFRTLVSTDFQTTTYLTPRVHTSRGMAVINDTACLVDPADGECKRDVVIAGRGSFSIDPTTRTVRFIPLATFAGVTPALLYRIQDTSGQVGQNWIRVTVNLPNYDVVYDTYNSTQYQTPITFMPNYLAVNPQYSTACLIDPVDLVCKTTVILVGQGKYEVNQNNGEITFTPAADFVGVVTPLAYEIVDGYGWVADNCRGQNFAKCYDTTDTCDKLDRGDHNAQYGDDCNRSIGGQHDNDLNNGKADHEGEYLDFCSTGYGDGDGEDDDNGFRGDHYGHDDSDDPYGYKKDLPVARDGDEDSLTHDSHEEGDYDDDNIDEGDDEGSHYCKNLVTSWIFMTVTSEGGIEAYPYTTTTGYQTPVTNFRPTANVTIGKALIDWSTLCLIDSATNQCVNELVLAGYGTFNYNPATKDFSFTPAPFFSGQVPMVFYRVCDTLASSVVPSELHMHCAYSSIKIRVADPDEPVGLPTHKYTEFETPITFPANVSGTNLLKSTVCIVDSRDGLCKTEITFPGQGTYSVDFATGLVTFVPAKDFWGDATHVTYRIVDGFGLLNTCAPNDRHCQNNQCLLQDPYKYLRDGLSGSYSGTGGGTYDCFRVVQSDVWVTVNPPAGPESKPVSGKTAMETPVTLPLSYNGFKINPAHICLIKKDANGQELDCVRSWFIPEFGAFDLSEDSDGVEQVTFTPVDGFFGQVPDVYFRVFDILERTTENTISVYVEKAPPPTVDPYTETIDHNTNTSFSPRVTGGHIIDYNSACLVQTIENEEVCVPGLPVFIEGQGRFEIDEFGVVTFFADYGFAGEVDTITYRIFDDLDQMGENTIKITVRKPELEVYDTEATTPYDTNWSASPIVWDGSAPNNPGSVMQYDGVFVNVKGGCFLKGDNTCVTTLTNANEGTWSINALGKVTFDPLNTFADDWTTKVNYRLCDGFEQCDTGFIRVFITKPVAPVVNDLTTTTPYQITKTGMLPAYSGGAKDDLSACVYGASVDQTNRTNCVNTLSVSQGTWTVKDDGTVDFDPVDGFAGTVTVTYEVCDQWKQCDKATITLTIEKPATPELNDIVDDTDFNTPWDGTPTQVLPTDGSFIAPLDYKTACLKVTINSVEQCVTSYTDPDGNQWSVDENGKVTMTPDPNFAGPVDPVTYCVKDNFGQEGCATITITVGKPAAPALTPILDETLYLTTWTKQTLKDNNGDLVCDPATSGYSCARPAIVATNPVISTACFVQADPTKCEKTLVISGQGTFTIDANGNVSFTPIATFANATTSCALYRVTDRYGQTGSACVRIKVVKPAPQTMSPFSGTTPYGRTSPVLTPTDLDLTDPTIDKTTACIKFTKTIEGVETEVCEKEYVDGKGNTWTIDPTTGGIKLKPGNKTTGITGPVTYCVFDIWGQEICTTVTVTVGEAVKPTDGAIYDYVDYYKSIELFPTQTYKDPTDSTKNLPVLTPGSGDFVSYCFWMSEKCLEVQNPLTLENEVAYTYDFGEGTWNLDPITGVILFEANADFYGSETEQLTIRAVDEFGYVAYYTVQLYINNPNAGVDATTHYRNYMQAVTFLPEALNADGLRDTTWEQFLDRKSACVIDPSKTSGQTGYCTKELTISKVGTWLVDPDSGEVTFIPAAEFAVDVMETAVVTYRVTDKFGKQVDAVQTVIVSSQPLATLNGKVFLDMNKNGVQDDGEPGLPGIEVTASAQAGGAIFKPVSVARAGMIGSKNVAIAAVGTYKVKTTSNGSYSFSVKPAAYKLTAVLNTNKIRKTSEGDSGYVPPTDSDAIEWSITTPVLGPGDVQKANFGAAGTGAMTGAVVINGTKPVKNAIVRCLWSGLDGILGNDDDLIITGVADEDGNFSFDGIPGGDFQCEGEDPENGQKSAKIDASVDQYAGKPTSVQLPLRKVQKAVFTISGFPAGRPTFTPGMIRQLRANMARYAAQNIVRVSIDGFTQGPTILQVDHKLSLDRARAAWTLIQTQDNTIKLVGFRGIQDYQLLGKKIRRVTVTLYMY